MAPIGYRETQTHHPRYSGGCGVKAGHFMTGCGAYFGSPGAEQRRNELRAPRTRLWWTHRWQRLSGNGGGGGASGMETKRSGCDEKAKAGPSGPALDDSSAAPLYMR
jgi:hypothetical protein